MLVLGVEEELAIRNTIEAESRRHDVYFVRVSRQLADQMTEWSEPVQLRFELDPRRDGEGQFVVRKCELT